MDGWMDEWVDGQSTDGGLMDGRMYMITSIKCR